MLAFQPHNGINASGDKFRKAWNLLGKSFGKEERDYLTCLPLCLCCKLVAFSVSLKYGTNLSPDLFKKDIINIIRRVKNSEKLEIS